MGIENQIGSDGITRMQTGTAPVKKRRTTSVFEAVLELQKPADPAKDKIQTGTRDIIERMQGRIEPGNPQFTGDYENIMGMIRQDLYKKSMSAEERKDALSTLEKLRTYLITPNSSPDQ